eukprot:TRINITY_DN34219_c0_g1_i1.p1 TRINITY_DN34219_c0_g1~~TRINITY_DN34219_c0_g1_i1.p1  ORF type:complete len:244 (+),score=42.73 TRINITY_DN34219_c0_g1_i1:84-734(+)
MATVAFTATRRVVGVTVSAARRRRSAQQHRSASLQLNAASSKDQQPCASPAFRAPPAEGSIRGVQPCLLTKSMPMLPVLTEDRVNRDVETVEDMARGSKSQPPKAPRLKPSAPPPCFDDMLDMSLPESPPLAYELDSVGSWVMRGDNFDRPNPPKAPVLRCKASPCEVPPPLEMPLPAFEFIEAVERDGGVVCFDEETSSYVRTGRTTAETCCAPR